MWLYLYCKEKDLESFIAEGEENICLAALNIENNKAFLYLLNVKESRRCIMCVYKHTKMGFLTYIRRRRGEKKGVICERKQVGKNGTQ